MKQIYGMGDIHFGDTAEWTLKAGAKFLEWLEVQSFGNKNDLEIILTGDITDSSVNAGTTMYQVAKLGDILHEKFANVYILTGNHDKKLHKKTIQSSLEMLKTWENIHIIEEPTKLVTPNGFKCLLLPYMRTETETLHEVYNRLSSDLTSEPVDIIAGHWNKYVPGDIFMDDGVDINNLPECKAYFIGHIHARLDRDYLGSVFPCKISEEDTPYPRALKVLNDSRDISELNIPTFLKYETVTYPNKIEEPNDGLLHIYTVEGCNNLQLAKNVYNGHFVRAVTKADTLSTDTVIKNDTSTIFTFKDNKEAFDSMVKEMGLTISRPLYQLVESLLAS